MAEPEPAFEGIVLHRQLTGESHVRLHVISVNRGLLRVLARQSKKAGSAVPDLFDTGTFIVELARGGAYFLKEFQLTTRRTSLATSYDSFQHACEFSEVFRRNVEHLDAYAKPVTLFEQTLQAFETGERPDAALLKSLYLLARMEGFPVKEEWLQGLSASKRTQAAAVLNQPLKEQSQPREVVEELLHGFRGWLKGHDFIYPQVG